jgi:hypothetical protein
VTVVFSFAPSGGVQLVGPPGPSSETTTGGVPSVVVKVHFDPTGCSLPETSVAGATSTRYVASCDSGLDGVNTSVVLPKAKSVRPSTAPDGPVSVTGGPRYLAGFTLSSYLTRTTAAMATPDVPASGVASTTDGAVRSIVVNVEVWGAAITLPTRSCTPLTRSV